MTSDVLATLLAWCAPLMVPALVWGGSSFTWLELLATVLAIWMVVCNQRVNPLGWPLAMASSALYALLFLQSKLYGEAGLQLVFIALAGWGWWQWLRGHDTHSAAPVRDLTPRERWLALGITLAAWPMLGLLLARITDSEVPYLDALPTVGSITGTILLARKRVENWPVWVAVNLVSLVLFATKGLWLTVALYALFALMAVSGWRGWAAQARSATSPARAAA